MVIESYSEALMQAINDVADQSCVWVPAQGFAPRFNAESGLNWQECLGPVASWRAAEIQAEEIRCVPV